MAYVDWIDEFSVGNATLDAHHRHLFELVSRLHGALLSRRKDENLPDILSELQEYTRYHFAEEERLMQTIGYAGLGAHKAAHERLIAQLEGFIHAFDQGDESSMVNLHGFMLGDWLWKHILEMDKAYAPFIGQGGAHPTP